MNPHQTETIVILGDPRPSRVGRHMYKSYLDQLAPHERTVCVLARDSLPMDPHQWSDFARRLKSQIPRIGLVFSGQEDLLELTSYLAEDLGLPHNPPGVADRVWHKDLCRSDLAAAGMLQPRSAVVNGLAALLAFTNQTHGPWIVKPRDGRGSTDVHLLTTNFDAQAIHFAMAKYPSYLVEEFVDGDEYSIEGVFLDGEPYVMAVTQKELFPGTFVEMCHQQPPNLRPDTLHQFITAAQNALRAVRATAGLFHVEAWRTPNHDVVVGEVHLRSGGDWIHTLLDHTRPDAPLFRLLLNDAHHNAVPPPPPSLTGPGAAARFLAAEPGTVTTINGLDAVLSDPATLYAELFIDVGDHIPPLHSSDDRIGVIVARGASGRDARDQAERLASLLQINVTPIARAHL